MMDNFLFGKILVVLHHINRMDKIVSKYGNTHIQTDIELIHTFSLQDAQSGERCWIFYLQILPEKKDTLKA